MEEVWAVALGSIFQGKLQELKGLSQTFIHSLRVLVPLQ